METKNKTKKRQQPAKTKTKTQPKDIIEPTEYQIHTAFVEYVRVKYPEKAEYLIHIPNEGKRSVVEGKRQKALGLCKGASDIFFPMFHMKHLEDETVAVFGGLWIEIKTKQGKETKHQIAFRERMTAAHYKAVCVHSLEGAIAIFEQYIQVA